MSEDSTSNAIAAEPQEDSDECTERQKRLVEAWLGDAKGNGTLAARMAGCDGSDEVCASYASTTLRIPKVDAYRRKLERQTRSARSATIRELREAATALLRDDSDWSEHDLEFDVGGNPIIDPRKLPPGITAKMVKSGSVPLESEWLFRRRAKKSERLAAMTFLAKMLGALTENVNVHIQGGLASMLRAVQPKMKPESFVDLLQALESVIAEKGAEK